MTLPPHIFNPYNTLDSYEQYTKYCNKYSTFKQIFTSFNLFYKFNKKHLPDSILYRHVIQLEGRKYHHIYN